MRLTQPLHKSLLECAGRTATVMDGRRRSYQEWIGRVARMAAALLDRGLRRGDRLALLSANSDELVTSFYAAWWAGLVVVPFNTRWHPDELAFAIDDSGCALVLAEPALWPGLPVAVKAGTVRCRAVAIGATAGGGLEGETSLDDLLRDVAPVPDARAGGADLAAIFYTGGTTGRPKGVMLSHDNLALDAMAVLAADERPPSPVGLLSAPLFHVGGASLMIQLAMRLATMVVMPGYDAAAALRTIAAERVSEVFFVPTMLAMLLDSPARAGHGLASVRHVVYGAAPMDEALLQRARQAFAGAGFSQAYGMTEASPVVTLLTEAMHRAGWPAGERAPAGRPLSCVEVRIVDSDGAPQAHGVGEIAVRGPTVMQGYWNRPEATAGALREGWLRTGDAGFVDADGLLHVVDRLKDMIISGGENVYSAEVENAILDLPGVAACAVVGRRDALWGETVHAVLVVSQGALLDAAAVQAHCRARLAGFKCPRSVEFRERLPLSAAGKLLKHEIRASLSPG